MSPVEQPADKIVAARITLAADSIDANCTQLEAGVLPVKELTARIRRELEYLRECVGTDAQTRATRAALEVSK